MTQAGQVIEAGERKNYRYIPQSSLEYDKFVLQAKENPGKWVVVDENFEWNKAVKLRQRRREPWYTDEGRIVVIMRDTTKGPDGKRRGKLIFEWEAKK